jgi:hypothetical protein
MRVAARQTTGSVSQLTGKFSRRKATEDRPEPCNEMQRKAVEFRWRWQQVSLNFRRIAARRKKSKPAHLPLEAAL